MRDYGGVHSVRWVYEKKNDSVPGPVRKRNRGEGVRCGGSIVISIGRKGTVRTQSFVTTEKQAWAERE